MNRSGQKSRLFLGLLKIFFAPFVLCCLQTLKPANECESSRKKHFKSTFRLFINFSAPKIDFKRQLGPRILYPVKWAAKLLS